MIQNERIEKLNDKSINKGKYVLYWMQSSQRDHFNHALEYSILNANELQKPLIVYFGITDKFPEANRRHYHFMFEGLMDVKASLEDRNIEMIILTESPEIGAIKLSKKAALVIVDAGYLKIERKWRNIVAKHVECPLIQVETNVIVPVKTASPKEEYSAATFRRKINKVLDKFLIPLENSYPEISSEDFDFESVNIKNIENLINSLNINENVIESKYFRGGTNEALKHLNDFINNKLEKYGEFKNDPSKDYLSNMSPYLHFGQISPLFIALKVLNSNLSGKDAFLEELIVRRELSMNFVYYNPDYDSFKGIPDWAKNTLLEHQNDKRVPIYSLKELENAATGDPYWNASQKEMMITGKMHGYMRMYWGKKILEWVQNPEEAYKIALYLNNKYEIDGRDPNGFTGVVWCFGKHDRAWKERKIFGKVRYMNANGLKRKFDADGYVEKIMKYSNNI